MDLYSFVQVTTLMMPLVCVQASVEMDRQACNNAYSPNRETYMSDVCFRWRTHVGNLFCFRNASASKHIREM